MENKDIEKQLIEFFKERKKFFYTEIINNNLKLNFKELTYDKNSNEYSIELYDRFDNIIFGYVKFRTNKKDDSKIIKSSVKVIEK
jgi:hypothetical protein